MKKKFIIVFFLTSVILNIIYAQEQSPKGNVQNIDNNRIRYIKQFPLQKGESKKPGIKRRISELIIGNKASLTISKPVAIEAKDPNNFIVLDQGSETIFQIKDDEAEIPRVLKKHQNSNTNIQFTSLVGISHLPNNDILFTDSRLNKIFVITADKKEMRELNKSLTLQQPTGIAWSNVNNELWVVETSAHRISVLNEKGELKRTIGKRGNGNGEFNFPTSIWIDKSGVVYIVDAMNFRVQIFNKDGKFESAFGEEGDATGYFARPKGIATDTYGNIYIADALFHVVQIFDNKGHYLYNFGSQGRGQGEFWMPEGLYIDDNNNIYVADSYNSRIQIFQLINSN